MSYTYGKILKILLVEDCEVIQADVRRLFATDGTTIALHAVDTLQKGTEFAQSPDYFYDLVILDLHLPDSPTGADFDESGFLTFRRWMECCPHIPVVIFTGQEDTLTAMRCIAEGAQDYVDKKNATLLPRVCQYAVERWWNQKELRRVNDLYRSVLDTSPELIIRFKPDMTVSYINKKMQDVINYHMQDFDTSCVVDFLRGLPGVPEYIRHLTPAQPYSDTIELRICGRYVAWIFTACFDDMGKISEYQAVGRDITYKLMSALEMAATLTDEVNRAREEGKIEHKRIMGLVKQTEVAVNRLQQEVINAAAQL